MVVDLQPGTYVVAVSGGVDSMALLHALAQNPEHRLVVAHFDHGIRTDSRLDRKLVQQTAKQYGLNFVYDEGRLGAGASEDAARKARYDFLRRVQRASQAQAVITAHHQGDLLETAVINLLRGTNRRGLPALQSRPGLHRPLLDKTKAEIIAYAKDQGLVWREDSTNLDTKYLRNHVRHKVLSTFADEQKKTLLNHVKNVHRINQELDEQLANYLHIQPARDRLSRPEFVRLSHVVAREVMAAWLRSHNINSFDKKTLERLVVSGKTLPKGLSVDIIAGHSLRIGSDHLALVTSDR